MMRSSGAALVAALLLTCAAGPARAAHVPFATGADRPAAIPDPQPFLRPDCALTGCPSPTAFVAAPACRTSGPCMPAQGFTAFAAARPGTAHPGGFASDAAPAPVALPPGMVLLLGGLLLMPLFSIRRR